MARKVVLLYLVKIVPSFVVVLVAWRALGVSALYHRLVAAAFDLLHPVFDPTGFVRGASVEGKHFLIDLTISGKGERLQIMGDDLTSNAVLLVALFLASPIKSNVKPFMVHLACAMVVLFVLHVGAVAATVQYAVATTPALSGPGGELGFASRWFAHYLHFYELIGTYLFVLVLWIPYVAGYLIGVRRRDSLY
jgi:hypothetical protein